MIKHFGPWMKDRMNAMRNSDNWKELNLDSDDGYEARIFANPTTEQMVLWIDDQEGRALWWEGTKSEDGWTTTAWAGSQFPDEEAEATEIVEKMFADPDED